MTITATKLYSPNARFRSTATAEKLEREFFSMIRIQDKINKTTWGERLCEVDENFEVYLNETGISPSRFLDVGVSSGISTWDWYCKLKHAGRSFTMTATDLVFHAYLVPIFPGLKVLLDRQGVKLQYDFFGYGIRPGKPRPRDWLNGTFLISSFMSLAYRWYLHRFSLGKNIQDDFSSLVKDWLGVKEIQLVSPRILGNRAIFLFEENLLESTPFEMKDSFDVVRAANLLNRDYFRSDEIITICHRLRERMAGPNSLLIVCRTRSDGTNHGTIFRLTDEDKLVPVKRVGEGSDIEEIVTGAKLGFKK